MNVQPEFTAAKAAAPADPRFAPPPRTQDETAAMGIAIGGIAELLEGRAAKAALIATKVFLFNFFLFGPIAALLALLWFR